MNRVRRRINSILALAGATLGTGLAASSLQVPRCQVLGINADGIQLRLVDGQIIEYGALLSRNGSLVAIEAPPNGDGSRGSPTYASMASIWYRGVTIVDPATGALRSIDLAQRPGLRVTVLPAPVQFRKVLPTTLATLAALGTDHLALIEVRTAPDQLIAVYGSVRAEGDSFVIRHPSGHEWMVDDTMYLK